MINLHENWDLDSDKYQWVLINKREGKDSKGNIKTHNDKSYHGTLKQVVRFILDTESKAADSLSSMVDIIAKVSDTIESTLHKNGVSR